jgi:hypothetical protein
MANSQSVYANIQKDMAKLVKAIPQAQVKIALKVGSTVLVNVVLGAVRTPVIVPIPTYTLALPNFNFGFKNPTFPVLGAVTFMVPIPVPVLPPDLASLLHYVRVTGGNVNSTIIANPQGKAVTGPVGLPSSNPDGTMNPIVLPAISAGKTVGSTGAGQQGPVTYTSASGLNQPAQPNM